MMVCSGPWRIYAILGAPLIGGGPGDRVHRRDQRPFWTSSRSCSPRRSGADRLVFQTQAVPAAISAMVIAVVIALAIGATAEWGEVPARIRLAHGRALAGLFSDFVLPFEGVSVLLLAAVIGGVFLAKREPGGPS